MTPTLKRVHEALVGGLDGAPMPSLGKKLSASGKRVDLKAVTARLPYLALHSGSIVSEEWDAWRRQVTWSLTGELKVSGPAGDAGHTMRAALDDLYRAVSGIQGLPVNAQTGKAERFSDTMIARARKGEVVFLADREGPQITSVKVRGEQETDPYASADVEIRIVFLEDTRPEDPKVPMRAIQIGILPLDLAHQREWTVDGQLPDGPRYTRIAFTPMAAPVIGTPFREGVPVVEGPGPLEVIKIRIIPAGPIDPPVYDGMQLDAEAILASGQRWGIASVGTWTSDNDLIAAVDETGFVSKNDEGTTLVHLSYQGHSAFIQVGPDGGT